MNTNDSGTDSLRWAITEINGVHSDSQIFFDGKIQKMVSVLAGMASVTFYEMYRTIFGGQTAFDNLPHFDARVFQLPNKIETANTFLWRERDATKNAISMAASSMFSHNELHKKNGSDMQEMMWQKGTNFNDYPAFFKRGTFVRRELVDIELSTEEYANIPENHRPDSMFVQRHRMVELDMPSFGTVTNRVEVIFDKTDPLTE